MEVLGDGEAHTREELMACFWDELSQANSLKGALSDLRKRINPLGKDVICEIHRNGLRLWRLTRLVRNDR